MSPGLYTAVWITLGFLLGSIPFGYLVARARGVDIRQRGSGNIGMTNVWRELGAGAGITVLVLDTLKGWLPVWLVIRITSAIVSDILFLSNGGIPLSRNYVFVPGPFTDLAANLVTRQNLDAWNATFWAADWGDYLPMLVGLATILGHTFSPWMKFKGGKGVATGLGVVLALLGWWSLPLVLIFLVTLAVSRYVSLGSIIAAIGLIALPFVHDYLPMRSVWGWPDISHLWPFATLVGGLVVYTHRENIKRILNGTERKVGAKKV